MILNKIKSNRKDRGFTIVELLVVIVVIGILAAITIVAYTGFTSRAKGSQTQANANSALQVISAYTADQTGAPNNGGGGTFATTAGLAAALTAYPNSKLPGFTVSDPTSGQPHPVPADVDVNGIGKIYYAGNLGQTGGCISYWNPATAARVDIFMGTAVSYATTGVCT